MGELIPLSQVIVTASDLFQGDPTSFDPVEARIAFDALFNSVSTGDPNDTRTGIVYSGGITSESGELTHSGGMAGER